MDNTALAGEMRRIGFAASGRCGALTTAGKKTDRTSVVDNGVTSTYCYDNADRPTLIQ